MNKQEAIDQLKESLSKMIDNIEDENDFNKGYRYATQHCFDIINQLDESEKPVVPKFVADWYEERKDYFDFNIYGFYKYFYSQGKHEEVKKWLDNAENKAIETLVKMKLYGYEVEKEKLYQVELPGSHKHGDIILVKDDDGDITYDVVFSDKWKERDYSKLTEDEIKKDHGWAWQFAKEVE